MSLKSFELVKDFVKERHSSAGVALVGYKGLMYGPAAFGKVGFFPGADPVNKDTIFDIASLTKVVVTTTLSLSLLAEGVFHLDTELGELIDHTPQDKAHITVEQLLSHTSGLPAWAPLYLMAKNSDEVVPKIMAQSLESAPGTQVVYSCLGFILLGHFIESITGRSLNELAVEKLITTLKLTDTYYNPPEKVIPRVAYTEWCPRSKRFLRGVVHDENAQALQGVSGNAGLFSTANDLAKFATMILNKGQVNGLNVLSETSLNLLTKCYTEGLNDRRTLGWMLYNQPNSSGGDLLSPSAIGHTGFTGTSLWIDLEKELFVILLTNRVHPVRTNEEIFRLRRAFHNAVVSELVLS